MKILIIIFFIFSIITQFAISANEKSLEEIQILTDKQIAEIERKSEIWLKDKKIPRNQLFFLYALGARNINKYPGYTKYVIKYYKKALEVDANKNENRVRVMLELGWVYREHKMNKDLLALVKEAKNFTNNISMRENKRQALLTLDYFQVVATGKLVKDAIGKEYFHFFGSQFDFEILHHELQTRMKKGLFKEAHNIFINGRVKDSYYYDTVLSFDLLNTIVKQMPQKVLRCEMQLKKQQSIGILMNICRELISYRKSGKLDKIAFKLLIEKANKKETIGYMVPSLEQIINL